MLNNLKETMDTAETLATLPTATLLAEEKCCDAYEIKPTTTQKETTTPTSSPTKRKSIFNWLKSATNTNENDNNSSTKGDNTSAAGSQATTPTTSPARAYHATDVTLVTSYREFCGVQSLRHLWNKRISAIEANNAKTSDHNNTKVKKLHKSISCLVSATANLNELNNCNDKTNDNFDTGQATHAKRGQAHTKRAQSLLDCTQIAGDQETEASKVEHDEVEINPLHREKDNFYKYKTAEPASKLWSQHVFGVSKGLSVGIVSGNENYARKFPAINTSEKGERIHWLRRDEIVMNTRRYDTLDRRAMKQKQKEQGIDLSTAAQAATDVISKKQTLQFNGNDSGSSETSDTLTAANSPKRGSNAANAEHKTSTSTSASTSKRSSIDSAASTVSTSGCRARRHPNSTRKYSFKTHAKSYHSTRKMHASKSDGNTSSSAASSFSMVAQLTQQFNEIIQKDKTLLQEVKRNNGVLMSRGGHVYKVVQKNDLRSSPGVSRTNSRAKEHGAKALNVRRAIRKFEGSPTESPEKPKVPTKSQQVLRKREELVSRKNRQSGGIKRKSTLGQKLQPSDKIDWQLKLDQKKLEIVKEEAKTPLEGDQRSIVEVLPQNVSSFNEDQSTYVSTTSSDKSNNQNVDIKINTVNQAETMEESDDKNKGDEDVAMKNAELVKKDVVVVAGIATSTNADNQVTANKAEQRQEPEGQATDASDLELLAPQSKAAATATIHDEVNVDVDVASTPFPTANGKNNEATAALVNAKNTDTVDSDTVELVDEEKLKQRKHRYAKIYEKFRFRTPFRSGQSKKPAPSRSAEKSNAAETTEEAVTATVETANNVADAKILDALDVIDQKLKGLTEEMTATSIVLCSNGDFEQRVLPNTSFIYQATAQQVLGNQLIVTQAVNVALVNTIGGEQILKEEQLLTKTTRQHVKLIEIPDSSETDESKRAVEVVDNPQVALTENNVYSTRQKVTVEVPIEDIYEPIAEAIEPKTDDQSPQESFIFKSCKNNPVNSATEPTETTTTTEEIYQTLEEINAARLKCVETVQPAAILDDYESIGGSCENSPLAIHLAAQQTAQFYDGYESFEPPSPDEPRLANATTPSTTLVRHTTDELPAIPEPKRIPPKSPMPLKQLRPAPPKPTTPPILNATLPTLTSHTHTHHSTRVIDDNDDQHYYADDENIYDTIKGSHCYESLQTLTAPKCTQRGSPKSLDTFSISSNCYESITHYRRMMTTSTIGGGVGCMPLLLHTAGSTSTLSSDHKTNSLYEASAAVSLMSFGVDNAAAVIAADSSRRRCRSGSINSSIGVVIADANSNNYSNSNKASSEGNSDDWVDITDNEADNVAVVTVAAEVNGDGTLKQEFIVVRERSKMHRSPDWSKRVRDKRLQQKKAISCIEDDSDHYYESLSPMGNKRHPTQMVQRSGSHHKRNQDLPRYALRASQRRQKHTASAHALGQGVSDDYDSFDTDTDDIYEAEENLKNQNDSGVDIRNVKLPEPPSSTNQVYAMVKKLKNFISSKKSPNASKFFGSQQKLYENSSQFYIEGNLYHDSPKTKANITKSVNNKQNSRKTPNLSIEHIDDYENTEFHTPPILSTPDTATKQLNSSEKNLSLERTNAELTTTPPELSAITPRSKSKSGKSFKARLRKSLVGSTFDSKQLSTLIPTRSTFYIAEPNHSGSGELDSGFSEKASTGDLTVERPVVPTDSSITPLTEAQKFSTATRKAKKEAKSANSQRRRTIIGIRPHEPPPPPPPAEEAQLRLKQGNSTANTSWYAECGVFKNGTSLNAEHSLLNGSVSPSVGKSGSQSQLGSISLSGGSHTSWYAEAGLYQTSDVSVASSSGSSGVSTGNEAGLGDELPHSMFLNEPLYQIYSAAKLQSLSRDMDDQGSSTDGYEEIGQHGGGVGDGPSRTEEYQKHTRPTALQLVGPKSGPSRTLWSQIPEVIHSCILHTLTPRERCLQEAKFEIITSEASYLKSLNLLRTHFMNHPVFRDTSVVNARDRKALFSHIVPVHECSERLLTALESCWQDNIMLLGLSKSIYTIAEKYFHVYISYCEHQGRMDRTLRRLKDSRGTFAQNLELLESSPNCCGLNLHSFLMLPMQRITRLPLLIDAVFSKTSPNDDEYDNWKLTFAIMNKIVAQCNEAANRCEQAYEIENIARQLEFPSTIRALAIAPVGVAALGAKPRFLVKKGQLTHLIWRGDDTKLTFGKKFVKSTVFAFLFSDLLVLTKRRAEQQFLVFDYCPRNMLTISSGDSLPQLPTKDINQTGKNLILMTLLENHERKTVELVLSCPSVSEQERWLAAMRPPEAETPGEKLYEQWDCPQVVTTHAYETKEPDALSLEVGDVINVTRKLPDGWYQGERIRDGAIGWFPGNHTEEVNSAHVRARNLKQRYRLLTFTASYLETQKRK